LPTVQRPEVVEPLDAGRDDDQQVGSGAGRGTERVRHHRWHHQEVAGLGGGDLVAGQDLERSVQDEEQFGGPGVVVRHRAVRALAQGQPLTAQRSPGGAGVGIRPDDVGLGAERLGVGLAHQHGGPTVCGQQRHGSLPSFRTIPIMPADPDGRCDSYNM
jgi:hypothetical protein